MPNWCECDLLIDGPKAKVDEFLACMRSEESVFDFNRLIPYPDNFQELDRIAKEWDRQHAPPWSPEVFKSRPMDGYNQGGHEWCLKNWGTKWPAREARVSDASEWRAEDGTEHARVELNFETPWSPPKPVIERAARLFPELRFDLRYFDGGAMFNGMLVCEKGEVVADRSGDYFGNRGG
jgi:hypothetical protein